MILSISRHRMFTNGGGGDKAPPPSPQPAPPPPPTEDTSTANNAAMQAEIERGRALRMKQGQTGAAGTTGTDAAVGTAAETAPGKTLLGA